MVKGSVGHRFQLQIRQTAFVDRHVVVARKGDHVGLFLPASLILTGWSYPDLSPWQVAGLATDFRGVDAVAGECGAACSSNNSSSASAESRLVLRYAMCVINGRLPIVEGERRRAVGRWSTTSPTTLPLGSLDLSAFDPGSQITSVSAVRAAVSPTTPAGCGSQFGTGYRRLHGTQNLFLVALPFL